MPVPFNLRQVGYALAVADHGSTAAAARALNVSQPSVSQAVTQLEAHFGQPLFRRTSGHGLQVTPFGRLKIPEFRRLLSQAEQVFSARAADLMCHKLTLGVFSTVGPRYVPGLVRLFTERFPGSHVELVEDDLRGLVDGLTSGRIDLAIMYDVGLPTGLHVTNLKEVRPYALVHEEHHLANEKTVFVRDLLGDPLILISLPFSRDFFLSIAQSQGLPVTIALETKSIEMVRSMVANKLGFSLLATDIAHEVTYDGQGVRRLEISDDIPPHKIVLAAAAVLPLTEASKAFRDLTLETFRTKF
ncbi:LysR family transcriptional regulator [Rhizobium sp.]|uniref:LysR family transcriptional regulator n=1 Tax=Rhizobium sp. TaxID=391 RepID=UPI0028AB843A